jgi:hypothetical protein
MADFVEHIRRVALNFDTPPLDTTNYAYIHAMFRNCKDAATWQVLCGLSLQHRRLSQ